MPELRVIRRYGVVRETLDDKEIFRIEIDGRVVGPPLPKESQAKVIRRWLELAGRELAEKTGGGGEGKFGRFLSAADELSSATLDMLESLSRVSRRR